jgi:probable HAF family extracellular repeat protein
VFRERIPSLEALERLSGGVTVKLRTITSPITIVALAALAMPVGLGAQDKQDHKHHHYQLIDLGTFGGPTSRNDGIYPPLNNEGTVIGMADTTTPDPFYPNFNPLILPGGASDPYIFRAFESNNGELVSLDSLPGGYSTWPTSISKNGLIAGSAINGVLDPIAGWPDETAVFWRNGKITNLGTLGGYESGAGMVNSRGQVTGFSGNAIPDPYSLFGLGTQTRAYVWDERNGMQDIGTLGGPDAASPFINERGQIAGFSYTSDMAVDPFLWEPPTEHYLNGKMIDLGSLGGTFGAEGDGLALNNRGQVVGASNLAGDVYFHPFLWTAPGPMRDLGTLGGPTGTSNAINEAGEVVGYADLPPSAATSTDAFLWKKGKMTDLGVLAGHCFSGAFSINAKTQVGGASFPCDGSPAHAFLWENGGPMVDLNNLVTGADMTLSGSYINDREEITGIGVLANGDLHAFLLIPCDEHHPGVEGCDYSMVEASAAVPESSSEVRDPASRTVPQSLMRRMRRYHVSSLALGPRN